MKVGVYKSRIVAAQPCKVYDILYKNVLRNQLNGILIQSIIN